MTVASFIAAQRTEHGLPHAKCCRWLGVSQSWFYKWNNRPPTSRQCRRADLDAAVKESFDESGGTPHVRVAAGVRGPDRRWVASPPRRPAPRTRPTHRLSSTAPTRQALTAVGSFIGQPSD
jgi:hypothetical protein